MKILITTPELMNQGGVASYIRTLKEHFSVSVDYFIIGARTSGEGTLVSLKRFIRDNWNFHKKLRKNNYDIVHLNPSLGWKAVLRDGVLLLIAKHLKHKIIVFFHGWNEAFEESMKRRYVKLFGYVYSKTDAFIVLGSQFREKLIEMGCKNEIYILTTAVEDNLCARSRIETKREIKNKNENRFNILFLSRIEKAKGIYEAIEAYTILKAKFPFVKMTIAGDGSELKAVKEYVKSNNVRAVEFAGYVRGKDKGKVFADADIYLFPTYGEGMPLSALEAMAFGLPIVTRPVGGIKDFFKNGKMGFITERLEPQVLADLL